MASFDVKLVEAAIERIKRLMNFKSDSALARHLEVNKQTLSNWKYKGTLDIALLKSKFNDISVDWLLHGVGEPYIKESKMFTDIHDVADDIKRIFKGAGAKFNEPSEEYKTGNEDRNRIPIMGSRVSAGKPNDIYEFVMGYYYTDTIGNKNARLLVLSEDTYEEHNFRNGDMIIIDTKLMPKDNNYIVIKAEKKYKIAQYRLEKGEAKYIDLESGKTTLVNQDTLDYIVGVVKTKIRDY